MVFVTGWPHLAGMRHGPLKTQSQPRASDPAFSPPLAQHEQGPRQPCNRAQSRPMRASASCAHSPRTSRGPRLPLSRRSIPFAVATRIHASRGKPPDRAPARRVALDLLDQLALEPDHVRLPTHTHLHERATTLIRSAKVKRASSTQISAAQLRSAPLSSAQGPLRKV